MKPSPSMQNLMQEYEIKRPSMIQSIKETLSSDIPLKTCLAVGAAGAMTMMAGATMEANLRSDLLAQGLQVLQEYKLHAEMSGVDFSGVKNLWDSMSTGEWTNQKTMVAGIMSGWAGVVGMAFSKIANGFGFGEKREQEFVFNLNKKAGWHGPIPGVDDLGKTLQEFAQMGSLQRTLKCLGKPGLLGLVNEYENQVRKNPASAQKLADLATHFQDESRQRKFGVARDQSEQSDNQEDDAAEMSLSMR